MNPRERSVAVGETMPDVRLETADGRELSLSSFHGRPLVLVCVRYYG